MLFGGRNLREELSNRASQFSAHPRFPGWRCRKRPISFHCCLVTRDRSTVD
jgi:hypothetical protein